MSRETEKAVQRILWDVQKQGDRALARLAWRWDKVKIRPQDLRISAKERQRAIRLVAPVILRALRRAASNIRTFAREEARRYSSSWVKTIEGRRLGQLVRPLDSVGIYIPGGRFPYPSTVLMTAIPARVAGVKQVVIVTPPKNLSPEVLAAAELAGVDEVYRIGGPGAIGALAYGTVTIQRVDKIVGPGNRYVTEAMRQVFGCVGIDLLAGPSEVVIVAGPGARPEHVALDLMAQAEHDPDARAILLSIDGKLLSAVRRKIGRRLNGQVELRQVSTFKKALELANAWAPEHLELLLASPERYLPFVRHAGAVFLGPRTPAALGDYVAGPSHVLPTARSARFASGLSVLSFLKRSSMIGFNGRTRELPDWEAALTLAETERMEYHARSLRSRMTL